MNKALGLFLNVDEFYLLKFQLKFKLLQKFQKTKLLYKPDPVFEFLVQILMFINPDLSFF